MFLKAGNSGHAAVANRRHRQRRWNDDVPGENRTVSSTEETVWVRRIPQLFTVIFGQHISRYRATPDLPAQEPVEWLGNRTSFCPNRFLSLRSL